MSSDLKRINRTLICKTTGRDIIVKPNKYEKLVAYYGSENKVKNNYISYTVEKEARTPMFAFWFEHCLEMKAFREDIQEVLYTFKNSERTGNSVTTLQNDTFNLCDANGINKNTLEFVQRADEVGNYVSGVIIKNIPFIKIYKIEIE